MPHTAAAQARGGSSEDAEYRQVVEEALAEFNRGNWEEAAALFERAHRINPSARTLRGMGLTAYEARRYVDAIKHLSEALTETRRPLTPQQREEVSATLDRARRFVAHLRLKVGPSDARVTINGRVAEPDSKGDVTTDPGLLDVEISADGYDTALRRVRLTAGGQEELTVQLSRVRTEVPVAQQPQTPPASTAAPAGAVQSSPVDEGGSAIGTLKWVVGGVAIAGLATGGVLLAVQKSKAADYENTCGPDDIDDPRCLSLREDVSVGGPLWTAPIVAFSVGGGLAVIAAVLFVVDATDDSSSSASNGCGLGTGDLGMQCRLHF
ncbi:MAG TPA: tetratricopeptide repeat protein [Polyangiales bacterium]|nr:tetratricopeptide repeat protein [Polyangiales bacterium]